MNWKTFAAGLLCGLLAASGGFYISGLRYRVVPATQYRTFLLDNWTGESWIAETLSGGEGQCWSRMKRYDSEPRYKSAPVVNTTIPSGTFPWSDVNRIDVKMP